MIILSCLSHYGTIIKKGFHVVRDLFDSQGEFISYERITNDYPVKISFSTYDGLKHAIIII